MCALAPAIGAPGVSAEIEIFYLHPANRRGGYSTCSIRNAWAPRAHYCLISGVYPKSNNPPPNTHTRTQGSNFVHMSTVIATTITRRRSYSTQYPRARGVAMSRLKLDPGREASRVTPAYVNFTYKPGVTGESPFFIMVLGKGRKSRYF